ncbi:hypothetical protein RB623_29125 [Mesorhizobium sp. LHD-90]|uniref:hypothetical protein n=1 Tax=Mesorhizobium sp. LHD-90 TaxID=3071414 RepID=UPI0027DEF287|nr:hypothetical protein [Mesorhizobium sp. LHD-90]MDQ6438135.1 hypothetical protein [Mesorhizobium sp. LHD-90]
MPRILTLFLVLHWAVLFSLLAGLAVFGGKGSPDSLTFFGIDMSGAEIVVVSVPLMKAALSFGFAICSVLFWWAFVTFFVSSENRGAADEVLRMAFAAASGLMTMMLLVGMVKATPGLLPAMAAHFAALIASYVAIRSEQRLEPEKAQVLTQEQTRLAARVRAIDASKTVRLSRFVPAHDGSRSFDR